LRTCKLNLTNNNIKKGKFKVCLEYHLGNCKGPCENLQSEEDYNEGLVQLKNLLKGNLSPVIQHFKSEMKEYAEKMEFEKAEIVRKKIEFIENYVRIQQVRFGDRLKFERDIDATCLNAKVPAMILQPLVENSVKYGVGPKQEGGTIFLTVRRSGSIIFFEVKDNGLGSKAKKVMDGTSSGIGMSNTDMRLKSYFGPDSRLRVRSSQQGYSVNFYIEDKDYLAKNQPYKIEHEPEKINV